MSQSESSIQKAVVTWWRMTHRGLGVNWEHLLFACPNGGARDVITGARLKAEGARRGVPDLILAVKRGPYGAMFLELKTIKGRQSEDQKAYQLLLIGQGYHCAVAHSWEEATRQITAYLKLPDEMKGAA
jgi:hypothetical protein